MTDDPARSDNPGDDVPTTEATSVLAQCAGCGAEVPVTAGVVQPCPSCGADVTVDDVADPRHGG